MEQDAHEQLSSDEPRPLTTPAKPVVDELVDDAVLEDQEEEPRRSVWGLVLLLAAVVVVVLILLLIPDCGGARASSREPQGGNTIENVDGMHPVAGAVSVWLEKGASIDRVINRAGIRITDKVSMGGGRYVLQVASGREQDAADRLVETSGVYDAGRVFSSDAALEE